MRKLLLLSVLFATFAIPAVAARDPRPVRGLRRALLYTLAFDVVYAVAVSQLYLQL